MQNTANYQGLCSPLLVIIWVRKKKAKLPSVSPSLKSCIVCGTGTVSLACSYGVSAEFQTASALHLKLFQGRWLFKRKLSSGAGRKQRGKNEFGFYDVRFCIEHDSESDVGMERCRRKVLEGGSAARQFPSFATLIQSASRVSDR